MNSNESSNGGITRRTAIATGVAALVVPRFAAGVGPQSSGQKLRIACIGVGGVGQDYVAGCKDEEIVALCDLDHEFSAPAFKLYPKARLYKDFRQMFDREEKNFDALIVATPDHWHSHLVLAGLAMNKHIYCAKPITRTIAEDRRVKAACLASSVTTKASIQDSCTSPARATTELLMSGAIGPIREVHYWTGTHSPSGLSRPAEVQTPPAGMDWDQWCGPSPARPYNKIYHYGSWRPWWDFGTGNVGDVSCHALHLFHDELELGEPDWVVGQRQSVLLDGGSGGEQRVLEHCKLCAVALSGARQTPGDDGVLLRWRIAAGAAIEYAARYGVARARRDVRRRRGGSDLRVLWGQPVVARPHAAAAGAEAARTCPAASCCRRAGSRTSSSPSRP